MLQDRLLEGETWFSDVVWSDHFLFWNLEFQNDGDECVTFFGFGSCFKLGQAVNQGVAIGI
jgi:hypothetical protein